MMISEAQEQSSVDLVGGKGLHLQKLVSWGAPVPPFFILTTQCFDYFQNTGKIPDAILPRFNQFFLKYEKIALRSSMISEDQVDSSFAGLFETILNVTKENWENALIKIFHSVNTPRVIEYLTKKNLTIDLKMAVVAQELVEVEKSGVLFTRSPIIPTALVAIDAGYGLGEGVVSGLTDVDHYLFTRTHELVSKKITNDQEVLSDLELKKIIHLGLSLEKSAGFPSDIEWGIKNNQLYVFQIRPITRSFSPLTYFVDTNLSESYPGVVSPFTSSFVKKAYENVFKESALLLGATDEKFKSLSYHYERLISSVDNHLYYNLEHYYAVLRALPGGEKNIENWHRMIGGKMAGVEIPYHHTAPKLLESLKSFYKLFKLALGKKAVFEQFLQDLNQVKDKIQKESQDLHTPEEIIFYLNKLIDRPLGFGLTVINDIFIMMGLGFLSSSIKKMGLKEDVVIDLLKTSKEVDSIKPLEHFERLVHCLGENFIQDLFSFDLKMSGSPFKEAFKELESKGFNKEVKELKDFLELYGDRSFEELKLESLPLKNNPVLLHQLILWAKDNVIQSRQEFHQESVIKLGFFNNKILHFTREAIAIRESTRLWRGKFYHLLRELILKLSETLIENDSSWREFSTLDFFSLSPEEWKLYAEKKMQKSEVMRLMKSRRVWQTQVQTFPEVIPWVEDEPLPKMNHSFHEKELSGLGVSQGVVEGFALVLEGPHEAFDIKIKDFILVTKNTDPAWVYIMSRSQGLISEKGSLLSHTAIIGRELNIPTIVGVKSATQKIKTGQKIRINATKGTIEIL
jgi:phosphohistidine swiveling domain-containing protein